MKIGNKIIIGNVDNFITKYFSNYGEYGLLTAHDILRVENNGVFIKGHEDNSMFFIPNQNIKKIFKNDRLYNKWINDFLNKNNLSFYIKDEDKNKGFISKLFLKNKNSIFHDNVAKKLIYDKLVKKSNKKVLER